MDIRRETFALSDPSGLFTAATAPALHVVQYSASKGLALLSLVSSEGYPLIDGHDVRPDPQELRLACDAVRLLGLPNHLLRQKAAQLQQLGQQSNVSMRTCLQVLAESERGHKAPGTVRISEDLCDESNRVGAIACLVGVSQGMAPPQAEAYVRSCRPSASSAEADLLQMMRQRRNNICLSASFVAIGAYFLCACHIQNRAEAKTDPLRANSGAFFRLSSILGFIYCGSYALRYALDGLTGTLNIRQASQDLATAQWQDDLKTLTAVMAQNTRAATSA